MVQTYIKFIFFLFNVHKSLAIYGQYYGFDGHIQARDRESAYKHDRVRVCTSQPTDECYFCDCYNDQCNKNPQNRQIDRYYKGLFQSRNDLTKTICQRGTHGKITKYDVIVDAKSASCGPVPYIPGQPAGSRALCCETEFVAVAPLFVIYNGEQRRVVQPHTAENVLSHQTMWIGNCRDGPVSCGTNGVCREDNDYPTFVLVHSTSNPLQFEYIPVSYNRFCRCTNPGIG